MSLAKVTLYGFHRHMELMDDNLFSKMELPENINKEILIDNILVRGGEFEVIYADPYFMQDVIGMWSHKWKWTFEHWLEALKNVDNFNPLENYDRTEEWENTSKGSSKSNSDSRTSVTAYDSEELKLRDQNGDTASGTSETEGTTKGRAHGNIGVTSLSQLFTEYQRDTATWNIYEHITDVFLQEFIIPVYT